MLKNIAKLFVFVVPILFVLAFFVIGTELRAAEWVTDSNNCSVGPLYGQSCSGDDVICGISSSNILYCGDTSVLVPPAGPTTVDTENSAAQVAGGYYMNCQVLDNASNAPSCQYSTGFWYCNRDSTLYAKHVETVCSGGLAASSTPGNCIANYTFCDGSKDDADGCEVTIGSTNCSAGANNNLNGSCTCVCDAGWNDCDGTGAGVGNGCEVQNGSVCSIGGLAGTYSGCFAGAGSCVIPVQNFQTGVEAKYSTTSPLLHGTQYGSGDLLKLLSMSASTTGGVFNIKNDGRIGIGTDALGANDMLTVGYDPANQFIINKQGEVIDGYWKGHLIGLQYGGTGLNLASSTGFLYMSNGLAATTTIDISKTDLALGSGLSWSSSNTIALDTAGNWTGTIDNVGFSSTLDANALWYGSAGATPNELTIGANGEFLMVSGGAPEWVSTSSARTTLGLGGLALLNNINNSNWLGTALSTANGGTGEDWSAVATGSIPYFSGLGLMDRLLAGVENQILQINSNGLPVWADSAVGSHNLLGTIHDATSTGALAEGDLVYRNSSSKWTNLARGNAGEILMANGTSLDWTATSSLGFATANWNAAYNWTLAGHGNWDTAYTIVNASSTDWSNAYNWTLNGHGDWDLVTTQVNASSTSWTTAYGWGNHADANYFDRDVDVLTVAEGGTGTSTFAQYSLIYASAANTIGEITTAGHIGKILQINASGQPVWASTSTLGMDVNAISGTLGVENGGTGTTSVSWTGFAYINNGTWSASTTIGANSLSSLIMVAGEDISLLNNNSNFIDLVQARAGLSEIITGIAYNGTTGEFSLTPGYELSLTASTTNWNTSYNWVLNGHGNWDLMTTQVSASSTQWTNAYTWANAGHTNWDTAYSERAQWDGGATNLVAATGRTSLGLGSMALVDNTGSTTIITVGTIGNGTWNGTAIGTQFGGTGKNWNTVATGSMPYFNGVGTMSTLGAGADGQVLKIVAGIPVWSATSSGAAHNVISTDHTDSVVTGSIVAGDLMYRNGSSQWSNLARGAAGEVLTVNGTNLDWIATTSMGFATGNWNSAYNWTNIGHENWDTAYTNRITSATGPLNITSNALTISMASSTANGYLTQADWTAFYNKLSSNVVSSLSDNYLGRWDAGEFVNSLLYDNGTAIGIGTTTPSAQLMILGNGSTDLFRIATSGDNNLFVMDENGHIGIGADATSTYQTYVKGKLYADEIYTANSSFGDMQVAGNLYMDITGDPVFLGVATSTGRINDVLTIGNYAYAAGGAFRIFDVTDPENPLLLSSLDDVACEAGGASCALGNNDSLYIAGNYAYMISAAEEGGIEILDVSNPINPQHVGSLESTACNLANNGQCQLAWATSIHVSGRYAYIGSETGFEIIDVSDPTHPTHVSSLIDQNFGATSTALTYFRQMRLVGNYIYAVSEDEDALQIVDVSNPSNPVPVGQIRDEENAAVYALDQARGLQIIGKYVYVVSNADSGVEVIDVSDPANPVHVSAFLDSACDAANDNKCLLGGANDLQIVGNYAYVLGQNDLGVEVLDISDPYNVSHIGATTTLSSPYSIHISGKRAYVGADDDLEIFEIPGIDAPAGNFGTLTINAAEITDSLKVIGNISVSGGMTIGPNGMISYGPSAFYASTTNDLFLIKQNGSGNILSLVGSNGNAMTVASNGFVGFGTADPMQKFHVYSDYTDAATLFESKLSLASSSASGISFATTSDVGITDWTNIENASSSDNNYAATTVYYGETSYYLKATNFALNIPANTVIDGIEVSIEGQSDTANIFNSVRLVKGGAITGVGTLVSGGTMLSFDGNDGVHVYGNDDDNWNEAWTAADINSADFGVVYSASSMQNNATSSVLIDNIKVKVYYSFHSRFAFGIDYSDNGSFKISNNDTLGTNDRFVIDANGNVGIGTSSPSQMLTVGTAAGSQFLVSSLGIISDGTWNGDVIGAQYGGTGKNWSAVATGSLPYFDALGSMTTLAAGTNGQILQLNGSGLPVWVNSADATGLHNIISDAHDATTTGALAVGDLFMYNGSDWTNMATGTLGLASSGHDHAGVYQVLDTELTSLAGLSIGADQLAYGTGVNTYGLTTLTVFARTLLDDTGTSTARATLGLGSLAILNSINNTNWSGAALAVGNGGTGTSTAATAGYLLMGDGAGGYTFVASTSIGNPTAILDADFAANGIMVRSGDGTYEVRTLATGTSNQIIITDGDGVLANPTFSLAEAVYLGANGMIGRDTDNLLDFSIDNQLTFRTNATDRMTLNSNGYLGLGTSSPMFLLDVYGSADGYLANLYNASTTATSGGLSIRADGLGALLNLNYAGTDVMTVTGAGTTFNHPVTFSGTGDISVEQDLLMTNGTAGNIVFNGSGYIRTDSAWQNLDLTLNAANLGDVVVDDTFVTTGTTTLGDLVYVNTASGNVGIGTNTPSKLLTVGATSSDQFLVDANGVISDGTWQGDKITNAYGGTGTTSAAWTGFAYIANGVWSASTTSFITRNGISESIAAIDYDSASGAFSLNGSYDIPLLASTTAWNATTDTVNTNAASWTSVADIVNASSSDWQTAFSWGNHTSANYIADADFATNGIMVRTGAGTYETRSATGTENEIVVVNGNGVLANPTFSLPDAVYLGSAGMIGRDANNLVDFSTASQIAFNTNGAMRMLLDASGNLMLGTSTPGAKLTVMGNGPQLRLAYDADTFVDFSVASNGEFTINSSGSTGSILYIGDNTTEDIGIAMDGNANDFSLGIYDGDDSFRIGTSTTVGSATVLAILNNGRIGIGTTTPGALLDVQGAAQFGTGNVNLIQADGRIVAINSTYFASLSGATLTNLNASNIDTGLLSVAYGGTGTSTVGKTGFAYINNGVWSASTTSFISRSGISENITGITYNSGTGAFSLDGTYNIPLTASTTNWNTAFDWGSHATQNYFDKDVDTLTVSRGGTGATTFTANGVLYGSSSSAVMSSAAGTSGQFLVANASGVPTFVSLSGDATLSAAGALTVANNSVDGTDIAITSQATGDLMYYNGTDWVRLAAGTSGSLLRSNGSAAPSYISTSTLAINSDNIVEGLTNLFLNGDEIHDTDFVANGIMVRTASGGYTSRTLTGAADQIDITYGDGVAANPIIGLTSAVYLGNSGKIGRDSANLLDFSMDNQIGFRTNNIDRMTLNANGYLGIGTTTPSNALTILSTGAQLRLAYDADSYAEFSVDASGALSISSSNINATTTIGVGSASLIIDEDGNVIVGTTTASAKLTVYTALSGTTSPSFSIQSEATASTTGGLFQIKTNVGSTDNIVFKIREDGEAVSDKSFNSAGADYAEYFLTRDNDLQAGETVCVDIVNNNSVKRCMRGADPDLMGVVSTNPAIIGNYQEEKVGKNSNVIVGMMGQVPALVTNDNGAIHPGDSLTSASSTPGFLMRANAGDSTVGVALESFNGSTGRINILISRRNKSLTVETVEAKVTERIAAMAIEDDVRVLITDSLKSLDVETQIKATINNELNIFDNRLTLQFDDVDGRLVNLEGNFAKLDSRLLSLENGFSDLTAKFYSLDSELASATIRSVTIFDPRASATTTVEIADILTEHNVEILNLQTEVAETKADVAGLESKVLSIEERMAILEEDKNATTTVATDMAAIDTSLVDQSIFDIIIAKFNLFGVYISDRIIGVKNLIADLIDTREIKITQSENAAENVIGEGLIRAGATSTVIVSSKIATSSKIFVTFRGDYGSRWWIGAQTAGTSTLVIAEPLAGDIYFDWWVIGVNAVNVVTPTATTTPEVTEEIVEEPIAVIEESAPVPEEEIIISEDVLPLISEATTTEIFVDTAETATTTP